MKGTQEIKEISVTKSGDIELQLWHFYEIILSPKELEDLIIQLQSALNKAKTLPL
jgi:hypothetical protein